MGIVFNSAEYATATYGSLMPYFKERAYKVMLNDKAELEWLEADEQGNKVFYSHEPDTSLFQRVVVYIISWLPVEWLL
uniref:Cardiolipin synthetase (EC) n=1 Tax=uncultured Thiotrichaceae bacterium TaxID=298394 RepID=A0A6S6UM55_9GAMM|nr:MAG: Cardiolipin synthetase (EC [uncultured Thiotrichaceae bacterium]